MPQLNDYHLRRWSLLVRLRDDHTCYVCGEKCKRTAQAHHIYPKSRYAERAYSLANGVTVCADHHQPVVHSQWDSWKKWVVMFRRYVKLARQRKFNERHQYLVRRKRGQD